MIQTAPPRARWAKGKQKTVPLFLRFKLSRRKRQSRPTRPFFLGLAAIVPGLGYLFAKRFREAIFFYVLFALFFGLGVVLRTGIGQICIGGAAALHAYSILDLGFGKADLGMFGRPFIAMVVLFPFVRWIYWPLAETVNRSAMAHVPLARPGALFADNVYIGNIIGFLMLLGLVVLMTGFISHLRAGQLEQEDAE